VQYAPAKQAVHADAPALEYEPEAQSCAPVEALGHREPAGHVWHTDAPVSGLNVPCEHGMATVLPLGQYEPAGQAVDDVMPDVAP